MTPPDLPLLLLSFFFFFFFNDTATTEIYTLSLHDALPICRFRPSGGAHTIFEGSRQQQANVDRKSTRLNSSHHDISYAVFCLKKKKNIEPDLATVMHGGTLHGVVFSPTAT